jgi:hypothetical protein
MLKKILTGAYTDVERGAFDFARAHEIAHGGWAPLGWLKKSALDRAPHNLQEVPHGGSPNYAERNIFDADGTLLITVGEPAGGSQLARNFAKRYRHPLLHIDLASTARFRAAETLAGWIREQRIAVLHVTGGSPEPGRNLGDDTRGILETALHIAAAGDAPAGRTAPGGGEPPPRGHDLPGTLEEALAALEARLSLKEKARIARTPRHDLAPLFSRLGDFVDASLGWWRNNDALITSCRRAAARYGMENASPDEILILAFWQRLKDSHGLRPVD